jgi:hypothetical protein
MPPAAGAPLGHTHIVYCNSGQKSNGGPAPSATNHTFKSMPGWLLPLALLQLAGCALTCAGGIEYEINSTVVWLWENVGFLAVVGLKGLLVLTALATHRLSRRLEPSDQLVFHGAMLLGILHMCVVCVLNVRCLAIISRWG